MRSAPDRVDGAYRRVLALGREPTAARSGAAAANRIRFEAEGTLALKLVTGPHASATPLLLGTFRALHGQVPLAVITAAGDDGPLRAAGARVRASSGAPRAVDARAVARALDDGFVPSGGLLVVGCPHDPAGSPAGDVGEAATVLVVSVDGDPERTLPPPTLLDEADVVVVDTGLGRARQDALLDRLLVRIRQRRGDVPMLLASALADRGLASWLEWLKRASRRPRRVA